MKTKLSFVSILWLLAITVSSCGAKDQSDYLEKVLSNLEKINSATYYEKAEPFQPGDTVPTFTSYKLIKEYDNPADSTIGASYVSLDAKDTTKLNSGYDGNIRVSVYPDVKGIVLDDFTFRPLPFRPLTPPFFSYSKNILNYALTTGDSISLEQKDLGDDYYFKLTIHEDKQVEFFGKAYYMPDSQYSLIDPTSIYEMWISKSNDLPYKIRREMSHSISVSTCTDIKINTLSIDDFNVYDYFPADYEIKEYGQTHKKRSPHDLIGKKAPAWILTDMNEKTVSLANLKSKVLLLNFTGIGCGPCYAAIPFLRELKESFSPENVVIVSIESWVRTPHSLRIYADKNKINYTFLSSNDEILNHYQTGRAAPYFFIVDEQRMIKNVFFGYGDSTAEEIRNAITKLL